MASWDEKIDACYGELERLVKKFIQAGDPSDPLVIEAQNTLKENDAWLEQEG